MPRKTTGQNRNDAKRERQGARCGWVPCPPNFLPGYQGGASLAGRVLSVRHDRWVGADTRAAPLGQARS
jgi:hypothetical protein